ncbi:hypothetical protein [Oryzomonas sagensis]|uniref:hypothetical protein n=1 Tax=Oryzomonas sagensis TaxID=2603857 RepID=UPI0017843154|nr:hypothetical protein [Oryzomonas sagensis]
MIINYQDRIRQSLTRWQRNQRKGTKDKTVDLSGWRQTEFNFDENKEDQKE